MTITTPVQVIALREHNNPETDKYIDMLRLAFEGESRNGTSNSYLENSIDLSIRVLDLKQPPDNEQDISRLLNGAQFSILAIVDNAEDSDEGSLKDDNRAAHLIDRINKHNDLDFDASIIYPLPKQLVGEDEQLAQIDPDIAEPGLQPVAFAIHCLHHARNLLRLHLDNVRTSNSKGTANKENKDPRYLKFFLSHAKIDGIPMALSLLGLMRRLQHDRSNATQNTATPKSDDYFYDVEHIQPGDDWRKVLEENAKYPAVLIALRTDEYEKRYWCQREYLWAESKGIPILVVDLRSGQYYDSARLPFDTAPMVKVHDGNLVRVILHAMAYDLRKLRYEAQLNCLTDRTSCRILPHKPSIYSLRGVMESFDDKKHCRIVYPNPVLPEDFLDSAKNLLSNNCELLSIDQVIGRF